MKNVPIWHYRSPSKSEYLKAIKELSIKKMRNAFSEQLYKEAVKDKNIYIVVADISPAGSMLKFREKIFLTDLSMWELLSNLWSE